MNSWSMIRGALIALVFSFAITSVHADTITLDSVGTAIDPGQTNGMGSTIAIAQDPLWAAPLAGSSWVSFTNTSDLRNGSSYVELPNGTTVAFYDTFNIVGTATGGTLTVMADDTSNVILNGHLLVGAASSVGNSYAVCSDFAIGCLNGTALTINLPTSFLQSGANTLQFDVTQLAGWSYGLDYAGSITDSGNPPTATPEPSSLVMLGGGILSLGAFRKKLLRA